MTARELAERLHGRKYGSEIYKSEEIEAENAGLVVVFGYSDDNIEFHGKIDDEVGAYEGTEVVVTENGLLFSDCGADDCPYFRQIERQHIEAGNIIRALWCAEEGGPSWTFATRIPHEMFDIMDGDEVFCRGIVFSISDLADV